MDGLSNFEFIVCSDLGEAFGGLKPSAADASMLTTRRESVLFQLSSRDEFQHWFLRCSLLSRTVQ